MAITVKDPETDRLAREVAALTGESLTEAIRRHWLSDFAASGVAGCRVVLGSLSG